MLTKSRVIKPKAPRLPLDYWDRRHIGRLTAPILDRLADMELQHGHSAAAEHLAARAAALREAVR